VSDTFFCEGGGHLGFIPLQVVFFPYNKKLRFSATQNNVASAFCEADRAMNVYLDLADGVP
jgi:hypothetical protein